MSKKNGLNNVDYSEYQGKKIIAFDLYGTCIHRPEGFFGGEKLSTYRELRKEVARNLGKVSDKLIKETTKELLALLQTQETDLEKPIELSNGVKIPLSQRIIKKISGDVAGVLVYKDFLEVVEELKNRGYIIAVVSNLGKKYGEPLRNGTIPEGIFDYKALSYEAGALKPDPKIFEYLKQQIKGSNFNEMVFVGDNLKYDVEGPGKVGMKPILINRKHKNVVENKEINGIKYIQIGTLKYLLDILK